jgi:ferrous-iron efflux pump FieF
MDVRKALSVIDNASFVQSENNQKLRRLATYASITVASVLIVAKLGAYLVTDSVAMLSSLLDSTIDLLASLVTAWGVASALRPPDHDHRFGHAKAEPLAALAQAAFIIGSSVLLAYEAISRLYTPHIIERETLGYITMGVAIVVTLILVQFQGFVSRRTGSMAISADKIHYMGDVAVNIAVVVVFALHQITGADWLDPVFAIGISALLSISAIRIAGQALHVLMDRELPDADRDAILAIVKAQPSVLGVHDLRTRTDSERLFIEFHLEHDENMTLKDAARISAKIVAAIVAKFPNADVSIHQDPAGLVEERLDQQIEARATFK